MKAYGRTFEDEDLNSSKTGQTPSRNKTAKRRLQKKERRAKDKAELRRVIG